VSPRSPSCSQWHWRLRTSATAPKERRGTRCSSSRRTRREGTLAARRGLPGTPGLATLALRARRSLLPADVLSHCQTIAGGVETLVGVAGREQSAALEPVLGRIVEALRGLPHVVVVDAGRVDVSSSLSLELLRAAESPALVTRATTEALVHTRSACESLHKHAIAPQLVLVGQGRHHRRDVAQAVGAEILGTVVDAPGDAALAYGGLPDPSCLLSRSVHVLAGAIRSRLDASPVAQGDAAAPSLTRPASTTGRQRAATDRLPGAVLRLATGRATWRATGSPVTIP